MGHGACGSLKQTIDLLCSSSDFGAAGEHVEMVNMEEYIGDPAFGTATTQLYKVLTRSHSHHHPLPTPTQVYIIIPSTRTHTHARTHARTHAHAHAHTHTCTHTHTHTHTHTCTHTHQIQVERGMSFSEAVQKLNTDYYPGDGFYLSKRVRQVEEPHWSLCLHQLHHLPPHPSIPHHVPPSLFFYPPPPLTPPSLIPPPPPPIAMHLHSSPSTSTPLTSTPH